MKVLLVGGGGREHALGWKIAQSPALTKLYTNSTNPGLQQLGDYVAISDDECDALVAFATDNSIDLAVIGPEAPLDMGLADAMRAAGVACFGPDRAAARLESSKSFMKEVCASVDAPTAAYGVFDKTDPALEFLDTLSAPFVIKADGLAAGKGVVIAENRSDADGAVRDMLGGRFGDAGARVVIEEFMPGEEASFFVISDGERVLPLIAAQDHKRAFDGETGPNTGGMGAYSPAPIFTDVVRQRTMDDIVEPVIAEMRRRDAPFIGVLYCGLMIENERPRLVEFNVRFGDPECQVLMRRLKSDLLPVLHDAARGDMTATSLDWSDDAAALVVMAAEGYPGAYNNGSVIKGVDEAATKPGVVVFHAGTKQKGDDLFANGGRVLNVTATGATADEAIARAYAGVDAIDWPEGFCRRDIGWRLREARS